jgi:hypothetical protein
MDFLVSTLGLNSFYVKVTTRGQVTASSEYKVAVCGTETITPPTVSTLYSY